MVVYYHTIFTDANPQHNKCPKGADSWCKYQQSLALKVTPPEHLRDDDPKRLIPLRLTEYVKPIFERLCSRELLAKCSRCCREYFHEQDVFRIKCAEKLQLAGERRRRKSNKRRKAAADERKCAAEGTTYQAGSF